MGAVVHRTTKQFIDSVDIADFDVSTWVRWSRAAGTLSKRTAYLALIAAGVAYYYVKFDGSDNPLEMTSGEKATVDSAIASAAATAATALRSDQRSGAQSEIASDPSSLAKAARAIAFTAMSEINLLREWIVSFKAAVAASTSLANLQTRVAALSDMPDRTTNQLITSITNQITSGAAD